MIAEDKLSPRDIVKRAFQFKETKATPFRLEFEPQDRDNYKRMLTEAYGNEDWKTLAKPYIAILTGCSHFLNLEPAADGLEVDSFGCIWRNASMSLETTNTTFHLIEPPLKSSSLQGYQLPDLDHYYRQSVFPQAEDLLLQSRDSFRVGVHLFGLFERAWSLRGYTDFMMDLVENEKFCEELVEAIADWIITSIDYLVELPLDAILITDDIADQRGLLFGVDRFRSLFKPRWTRIFDRIHRYGLYTVLHMCGNPSDAIPDLIDCGLDCVESLQPEAMDVYKLKQEYGRDLRFWGGVGVQNLMPFGTAEEVDREVRLLREKMGSEGGYILATSKDIARPMPIENVVAYLEAATT